MTKDQLVKMGVSEDLANAVMALLDGNFVTKSRFDEVNNKYKSAQDSGKTVTAELGKLKSELAEMTKLKEQMEGLQKESKTKDEAHIAELKKIRVEAAVDKALLKSGARNPATIKPLLKLDNPDLDESGEVVGLGDQLKSLVGNDETKFLFNVGPSSKPVTGLVPTEKRDGVPGDKDSWESLSESKIGRELNPVFGHISAFNAL